MMKITEKAQEQIADYFKDKEATPVRIFLNSGGWGGPSLAMALDELKENDEVFEVGGNKYVIEKELLAQVQPVTVDFNETGFKIDGSLEPGDSACGGCSSAGGCS